MLPSLTSISLQLTHASNLSLSSTHLVNQLSPHRPPYLDSSQPQGLDLSFVFLLLLFCLFSCFFASFGSFLWFVPWPLRGPRCSPRPKDLAAALLFPRRCLRSQAAPSGNGPLYELLLLQCPGTCFLPQPCTGLRRSFSTKAWWTSPPSRLTCSFSRSSSATSRCSGLHALFSRRFEEHRIASRCPQLAHERFVRPHMHAHVQPLHLQPRVRPLHVQPQVPAQASLQRSRVRGPDSLPA